MTSERRDAVSCDECGMVIVRDGWSLHAAWHAQLESTKPRGSVFIAPNVRRRFVWRPQWLNRRRMSRWQDLGVTEDWEDRGET